MTQVDTSDVLERATHYDPDAVGAILEAYVPMVHRMACGLSGREDVARGVEQFVIKQGLRILPKWQPRDGAAGRWFAHHTVLTARRAEKYAPDIAADALVRQSASATKPLYVAFVKAIRALDRQQGEAWLLTNGEGLDLRSVAVAMDCSTEAAKNHLAAAEAALRTIGGAEYAPLAAEVKATYQKLTPTRDWVAPVARKYVRRFIWPRRVKRAVLLIVILAILAGLFYTWRHGWLSFIPGL